MIPFGMYTLKWGYEFGNNFNIITKYSLLFSNKLKNL